VNEELKTRAQGLMNGVSMTRQGMRETIRDLLQALKDIESDRKDCQQCAKESSDRIDELEESFQSRLMENALQSIRISELEVLQKDAAPCNSDLR
jgi:hypothetical protein